MKMDDDIEKRLCSGIRALDKLRFKAAGSRTGSITVSIEELNAIRAEIETSPYWTKGNRKSKEEIP